MDNPEKLAAYGTQDKDKHYKNTTKLKSIIVYKEQQSGLTKYHWRINKINEMWLSDYSLMCKCNSIPAILITRTSLLSDYSLLCKCNSIPAILITRTSFQTINRVIKKRHWVYQWTGHVDYHRKKEDHACRMTSVFHKNPQKTTPNKLAHQELP